MFALRTSLVCALLLLFAKEFSFAQVGLPLIRNYSPKEYGQLPQVWGVHQDQSGLLYFGVTGVGAIQYDGVRWLEIPTPNRTRIYSMVQSTRGLLYAGGLNDFGRINHQKRGDEYQSLRHLFTDSVPDFGTVWSVHAIGPKIFFLTYRFIFCFDEVSEQITVFPADPDERFFGAFVQDSVYYFRQSGVGILQIINGKKSLAPAGADFKDGRAYLAVTGIGEGEKLIATKANGMFIYDTRQKRSLRKFHFRDSSIFQGDAIFTAATIDTTIILGSFSQGAALLSRQGDLLQSYQEKTNLQNNAVNSFHVDKTNNIWIATSGGISKSESGVDLSFWNKANGIKGIVYDVISFDGHVYVATETAVFRIDDKGRVAMVEGISPGQYWSFTIFETDDGPRLIVGGPDVFEIKGAKARMIHDGHDHAQIVYQSRHDRSRLIALHNPDVISYRFDHGRWIFEGKWEGVSDGGIRAVREDKEGNFWFATNSNGIIRVVPNPETITKPKEVKYYTKQDGLPSIQRCNVLAYRDKVLFGTEGGLYGYNPRTDRFEPSAVLGKQFCDSSRSVFWLREMPDGRVVISSSDNVKSDIVMSSLSNGNVTWVSAPFKRIPTMSLVTTLQTDAEGNIWVGGTEGLFKYTPHADKRNYDQPFYTLIRRVIIGRDSLVAARGNDFDSTNQFTYDFNSVKFEFAAPFFDQEERTLYSYRLHGFDSEWSAWVNISTKEYTNLPAGTYQFEVKAKNVYGNESKSASYFFDVVPPWYATSWAYAIYVAALAGIFYAGVKIYTIKLQKDKLRLQQKVDERTKELVASEEELRMNLEVLNATLENLSRTQEKLIQSEKMASLGQLTAGISHEINNPMNFISGGVQQLMEMANEVAALVDYVPENKRQQMKELSSDMTELTRVVLSGVERTTKIIKGLKVFSNPSEVIPDEPVLDVRDAVEGSVTIMMSKIREHGVELKYEMKETPLVRGNGAMISQVVTNIIDNAIDALASIPQPRTIELKTFAEGNQVIISVRDNGPGIPAEHQTMIMNPFFTTKEVGKGTGLGLSISFSIMKKHNGSLEFVSSPGQGTEFKIGIPI